MTVDVRIRKKRATYTVINNCRTAELNVARVTSMIIIDHFVVQVS